MTAREQAIIHIIESLPRDDAGLEALPVMSVVRAAVRLRDALDADTLQHLLHHPNSLELPEQRRARTGVDWHATLVDYVAYSPHTFRELVQAA